MLPQPPVYPPGLPLPRGRTHPGHHRPGWEALKTLSPTTPGAVLGRRRPRSSQRLDGSASQPSTALRRRLDGLPAAGTGLMAGDGTRTWCPRPRPSGQTQNRCTPARTPRVLTRGFGTLRDPYLAVSYRPAAGAGDTPLGRAWVLMPRRRSSLEPEAVRRGPGSRPPAPRPHPYSFSPRAGCSREPAAT